MAEIGQPSGQQFYITLKIKDIQLNSLNIISLVIREWIIDIIPTIEIQFEDDGFLFETAPLQDAEDIEVSIAKNEDDQNPLELNFSLDDFNHSILGDNRRSIVSLVGHLKVDDMFRVKSRSFSKRNSLLVLQDIADESGLNFRNPRLAIPSDSMNWYQLGLTNFDFIKHVLKRAYIPNDALLFFANTKNEFVYTSLNKEMNKFDFKIARFNVEKTERNYLDNINEIWFSSYDLVNYAPYYNKKTGYGAAYGYYDLKGEREVDFNTNFNKLTTLSFMNKDYIDEPVYHRYGGDFIERNLYGEKYFESRVRNKRLIENFFSISLVININALSQVSLLDKIDLQLPSIVSVGELNEVYSGEYLVGGVIHEITMGGVYRKYLSLHRNGINRSETIKQYEVK